MTKTITGKTIRQAIRDGDIKVGDFVKVDRDVSCHWHEGVKILSITDDQYDGTVDVVHSKSRCCCSTAQFAKGLTIEVTREESPERTQTKQTTMQKITSALKRALNADLQAQYRAGYINGELELTEEGRVVLLAILVGKFSEEFTKEANEKIAGEEK